jgi:eukaryotic-like serine/threonine-protein kinase
MAAKQLDEEAIFNAARRIEGAEARSIFIKQACGDNADVVERVMALLEAHERDPQFMQSPDHHPALTVDYAPIAERPGSRVGNYRLMEQIGEGGFGLVFVAEQLEPVRRKVALKVIKPGMDSSQVISRFEAERQALAMMDHPNIARVLDAGSTDSGRPYFVMELVRGIPITEYCDQNQLDPRERLELFVSVCQAIQHAHQKGIIHRDVKPSNVLVTSHDGKPVVKVIDFGVAKAIHQPLTERTIYTNFAQMIGTPLYMSPEQAEMSGLDIDTRSDIYSLGVLLYELLTGSTPLQKKQFATAAFDEIRRMIREEDLPRPSQRLSTSETLPSIAASRKTEPARLSKMLQGEVDWIVMKALEKDRTRRYETASGLAQDIQRYLADEPVEACPPSASYKLKKFARKHRAVLMTLSALAALLIVGVALSGWQAVRARQAEIAAWAARNAEAEARNKADTAAASEKDAKDAETVQRKLAETERDAKRAALGQAESLRLTAQSSVVLPNDPGLALLLAIEGARRAQPRNASHNNALVAALNACREVRTLRLPNVSFTSARFSRDGRFVLSTSGPIEGRRINAYDAMGGQIWDATGEKLLHNLRVPGLFFSDMELSPDGRRLATSFKSAAIVRYADGAQCIYSDHSARIWDVVTGKELLVLRGHTDRVVSVRFSPDGSQILTASWDKSARLWDASTGKQLKVLKADNYSLASASFSANGSRVLTFCDGSTNESSAAVQDFLRQQGWKADAELDPPLHSSPFASAESLFSTRSGGAPWSSNEDTLARARLWDPISGKEIATLIRDQDRKSGEHQPRCAEFAPDGRSVLIGDTAGITTIWDADDGKLRSRIDPPAWKTAKGERTVSLRSVTVSRDGRRLLRLHADHSISVVDIAAEGRASQAPREIAHFTGFAAGLRGAAISNDGARVLILPGDEERMERRQWLVGSDGKPVLNTSDDRTVYLRGAATGRDLAVFRGHEDDVASAAFHPNQSQVVTASRDGTIRIWDASERDGYATTLRGHTSALATAAISPDGRLALTAYGIKHDVTGAEGGDREVRVWDHAGNSIAVLRGLAGLAKSPLRERLLGSVQTAQFSPDGRRVLVASADYQVRIDPPDPQAAAQWPYTPVRIFDARSGEEQIALKGFSCDVRTAAFSPDGRLVLTVAGTTVNYRRLTPKGEERGGGSNGGERDHAVRLWNSTTGDLVRTLADNNEYCQCAVWSRDGRRVAAVVVRVAQQYGRPRIVVWDAETGAEILTIDNRAHVEEIALSADAKRLLGYRRRIVNEREIVHVWDAETGKAVSLLKGHLGDVTSASFSPDSRLVVTTSLDHTARVWDAADGKPRLVLTGHERAVQSAAFSGDSKWIVTGSDDGTARVWDAASGQEIITLSGHGGPVFNAVFSPDAGRVLTVSGDGLGRIWTIDPLPAAIARKPRELTTEERQRFGIDDSK